MTKPIELGLELQGEDAEKFHEYRENATCSSEVREMMRRVIARSRDRRV